MGVIAILVVLMQHLLRFFNETFEIRRRMNWSPICEAQRRILTFTTLQRPLVLSLMPGSVSSLPPFLQRCHPGKSRSLYHILQNS